MQGCDLGRRGAAKRAGGYGGVRVVLFRDADGVKQRALVSSAVSDERGQWAAAAAMCALHPLGGRPQRMIRTQNAARKKVESKRW
jgi:hypothetical protein